MNKYLRRFVAIMVGCSLVIGGAAFAGEKSTADKIKTTLEDNGMKIEEMDDWSDTDWDEAFEALGYDGDDWDDEEYDDEDYEDFDFPETGADFVKELVEEYSLTEAEKVDLENLYDEAIELESENDVDWEKVDSKWEEIDNILLKYDMVDIMNDELPTVEDFVKDMYIDQETLTSDQLEKLEDFRDDLEKHQKAGDVEKFSEIFDDLFTWVDENIEESQWDDSEEFDGEYDDYGADDEYEDMTEEEYNKMIIEEIKSYSAEDLLEEFAIDFSDEDEDTLKSLYVDMVKAAEDEDMDKIDSLYEEMEEIFEKYEDEFEAMYEDDFDFEGEYEDMTDEEYNSMIFDEIKAYSATDLLEEIPFEIAKDDADLIKSIHADMVEAAEDKDMEKIETLYDELEDVFEKYEDGFDKYYDELSEEDQE